MKQIKDRDLFSVKSINHEGVKKTKTKEKRSKFKKLKQNEIDDIDRFVIKHVPISYKNDSGALFHVGKCESVKIAEHNPHGALVVIKKTNKIGSIPKHHLTDSNMLHPEEKCRIGRVFQGRILKYTPGKDPVLTLKTDLVTSKLPIITELNESNVGTISLGCVVKIYKKNLLVEFFNDCKALVLGNDIPPHQRKDLNEHFQVGSVVKCKITSYDDSEKKLFASLMLNSTVDNDKVESKGESPSKSPSLKYVGKIKDVVNCKIFSVNEENIHVIIEGFNDKGCIPFYHFADDVGASKSLFRLLNEGDELKNLVVFSKSKSEIILSAKPSIHHYVKGSKNEKLETAKICPSVVRQCFEDKVLVTIMEKKGKSEHFIPKDFVIRNKIDSVLNIGMKEGQTLFLNRVKTPKTEFCSYLDKVLINSRTSGLQLLYDTLLQEAMIRKLCSEMKALKLKEVVIGGAYEGKIIHISKAGALVRVSELGLDGVIHPSHYSDSCIPKTNETLEVRVLNVNYYELCLELTASRDIREYYCKKDHNLNVKQEGKCHILLAKKDYIIGRLINLCPGQIIYLPSKRHINDFKGRHSYYETGKQYDIIIEHIDEELVLANLKVHAQKEFLGVSKEIPSFSFNSVYLRSFVDDLLLDEARYTHHDFKMRAAAKIERVSNFLETKKNKNVKELDKWETLKGDKFSQLDEERYWKNVLEKREERKKLKKEKFGPIKVMKRKFNESFDENTLKEDHMSNVDSGEILEKDSIAEQSDNLTQSVQSEAKRKRDVKKRKLDSSSKDSMMKENLKNEVKKSKMDTEIQSLKQENENVVEENSDSDTMDEDDDENSSANFCDLNNWNMFSEEVADTRKEEEDDDDDEDGEEEADIVKTQKSVKKLSKYEKSLNEKTEEMRTRKLELERLDEEREPQSALDFEEKIEQNPHSAAVWIEYISFHLESDDSEHARAVATRALARIPPTKEEESLALWNVSLRLEAMYGTAESLENSFKEALARNDELKIYYIMINIHSSRNELKKADELIKKMLKKHSQNREVWIKAFLFYFNAKEFDEARSLYDRSFLSLPKSDHVEIINRFAQLELKQNLERGKTLFESLLGNFPKRLDIWNVYADLLVKQNDIQGARNVLERITGLKLKMKPMRNAFKKLLEFEKKHGTPQRVEAVKAKVEQFVTKALAEGN